MLYYFGLGVLLMGLAYISEAFIAGLLIGISGLLMFPIIYSKLAQCFSGKIKGWKYVVIVMGLLFFGMGMLPQEEVSIDKNTEVSMKTDNTQNNTNVLEEKKEATITNSVTVTESITKTDSHKDTIDKAFKKENYKKLVEMYSEFDELSRNYLIEQIELKVVELLKNENTNVKVTELETFLGNFQELPLDSELVKMIWISLQRLQEYSNMEKNLKSYTSSIPKGSEAQWLEVYITHRVKNSGETGGYTDYYAAYPYKYLFNEPYPDYDGEQIIVYSESPLSKGVNYFSGVENGTYKTIDGGGFERTSRLFHIYSDTEWEQYYLMMYMEERKEQFNDAVRTIKKDVLKHLLEKNIELAEKTLLDIGISLYCGYWYDEDYTIGLEIIEDAEYGLGKVDILMSRFVEITDTLIVWNIEDACYDIETGTILYENSICEQENMSLDTDYPSVEELYSDGKGKIFLQEGTIRWEDAKENISTRCRFE